MNGASLRPHQGPKAPIPYRTFQRSTPWRRDSPRFAPRPACRIVPHMPDLAAHHAPAPETGRPSGRSGTGIPPSGHTRKPAVRAHPCRAPSDQRHSAMRGVPVLRPDRGPESTRRARARRVTARLPRQEADAGSGKTWAPGRPIGAPGARPAAPSPKAGITPRTSVWRSRHAPAPYWWRLRGFCPWRPCAFAGRTALDAEVEAARRGPRTAARGSHRTGPSRKRQAVQAGRAARPHPALAPPGEGDSAGGARTRPVLKCGFAGGTSRLGKKSRYTHNRGPHCQRRQ